MSVPICPTTPPSTPNVSRPSSPVPSVHLPILQLPK